MEDVWRQEALEKYGLWRNWRIFALCAIKKTIGFSGTCFEHGSSTGRFLRLETGMENVNESIEKYGNSEY